MPRSYTSAVRRDRAEATRRAVIDAALTAFSRLGWRGTSMQRIADDADVAVETVYRVVPGGKAALLEAAVHAALAGGAERAESAVDARPGIRRVIEAASPREAIDRYAATVPGAWRRAGPLLSAVDGAEGEASLTRLRGELEEQRRNGMRRFARRLDERGSLRTGIDIDRATDVLWTLCSRANYQALVVDRHWPESDYAAWLARMIAAELLAPAAGGD